MCVCVSLCVCACISVCVCVSLCVCACSQVTDTPGVSDTDRREDEVLKEVSKSVAVASPGPHIVLMVLQCGRFTAVSIVALCSVRHRGLTEY